MAILERQFGGNLELGWLPNGMRIQLVLSLAETLKQRG